MAARDFLDHHEADVVSRCRVLYSGIAQPDDQARVLPFYQTIFPLKE
jgi:hypothetical protein